MPFMRGVRGWDATAGWRGTLGLVMGCVDRGRALVRWCEVEEPRGRGDSAGVDMVRAPARQVVQRGPRQGISKIEGIGAKVHEIWGRQAWRGRLVEECLGALKGEGATD
jgi:hypothetical protein